MKKAINCFTSYFACVSPPPLRLQLLSSGYHYAEQNLLLQEAEIFHCYSNILIRTALGKMAFQRAQSAVPSLGEHI